MVLEARDMSHAIRLLSRHPAVRLGVSQEIGPADEEIDSLYQSGARRKKRWEKSFSG
jgi:hypothetical protein